MECVYIRFGASSTFRVSIEWKNVSWKILRENNFEFKDADMKISRMEMYM